MSDKEIKRYNHKILNWWRFAKWIVHTEFVMLKLPSSNIEVSWGKIGKVIGKGNSKAASLGLQGELLCFTLPEEQLWQTKQLFGASLTAFPSQNKSALFGVQGESLVSYVLVVLGWEFSPPQHLCSAQSMVVHPYNLSTGEIDRWIPWSPWTPG